jgi:hypothetical protein
MCAFTYDQRILAALMVAGFAAAASIGPAVVQPRRRKNDPPTGR